MSFCIELFCVVTLQYQILVRIAIAYFIIEKKKAAPQPWQAIAQRFCSIGSYHVIYNKWLRERIEKESSLGHYNSMNVLSMHALIGAYSPEGNEWVDELRQVIGENVDYACNYIEKHFEGVEVSRPQGTYMLFLDCEKWCKAHGKTLEELHVSGFEAGVFWQNGEAFQKKWAIRMNLALPLSRVKEAFDRLDKYVFN